MLERNAIVLAESGTGKTVACSIALLQSIEKTIHHTQVLCILPPRKSPNQIQEVSSA